MPRPTSQDHADCKWAAEIMISARKTQSAPDIYRALEAVAIAYERGTTIPALILSRGRQAARAFRAKAAELQKKQAK